MIKQKILANDFYKMLAEERSLFQKHSDYSNKLMTGLYIGLAIYGGPASLLAYGLIEGARSGIRAINNPFLNKLDSSLQFTQLLMNPWPAVFSKGAAALTGKVFDTLLDPHSTTPKWARSWLVTAKPYSVAAANYGGSRLGHYTAKKYIPETFQNFQNMAVALSKQVSQQVYFQNQTDVFSTNQQSEEGPVSVEVNPDEPFSETAETQGESFNPEIRELKPETQSTLLVVGEDEVQTHSVSKPERTGAIEDRWSATYESKVSSNNATMSAPDFVSSEQEIFEPKPGVRSILESPDELNELAAASNASRVSGGVTFDPNTQSAVPSPFIKQEAVCSLDESPGSKPMPFPVASKETSSHRLFDVSDKPSKLSDATAGIYSVSEASQSSPVVNSPIGESVTGSGVVLFDQTTSVSDVSDNNLITIEVIPSQLGEQGKAAFSEFLSQNPSLVEPVSSAMQKGLSRFKIVQTDSGFQLVTDEGMSPTLELGAPESVGFNNAAMCAPRSLSTEQKILELKAEENLSIEITETEGSSFNPKTQSAVPNSLKSISASSVYDKPRPEQPATQLVVGEDEVQTHSVSKPERTGAIEDRLSSSYKYHQDRELLKFDDLKLRRDRLSDLQYEALLRENILKKAALSQLASANNYLAEIEQLLTGSECADPAACIAELESLSELLDSTLQNVSDVSKFPNFKGNLRIASYPDFSSRRFSLSKDEPVVRSILDQAEKLTPLVAASNASRVSGGVTFDPNTQSAVPSPFIKQEAVCSLDESPGSKPSKPLPFLVASKEMSSHGSFDVSDRPSKPSEATAGICSVSEASQSGSVANPPIGESVTGSGVVLFGQPKSVGESGKNLITIEVIPSQLGEQGKAAFSEFLSQNPSLVEPVSSAMQNGLSSFKIVQTDSGFQLVTDDVMSPTLELGAPESVGFNNAIMCDAKDHSKSLEISEIQAHMLPQPLPRFTEGSAEAISTQVTKPVSSSIVDRIANSTGNPYERILSSRQTVSLSQAALERAFPVETSEPTKVLSLYFSHSKAEEDVCSLPKQHSVVVSSNQDDSLYFYPVGKNRDALPGVTYSTKQSQVAILDSSVTTNQVNPFLDSSSQAHLEFDLNEMDANGIAFLNALGSTNPELFLGIHTDLDSNNGIIRFSIPAQEIPVILSLYQDSSSAVSFYGGSSTPRLLVPTSQSVKLNPKSTLDFGALGRLISGIWGSTTDSSLSPTINADGKPVVSIPSTAAPVLNLGKFTAAPKGSFVPEINIKSLLASSTFFNRSKKSLEDKCPVKSEAYPLLFGPPKSRSFLGNVAMNPDPSTPEEVQSSNPDYSFWSLLKGLAMTDPEATDELNKRIRSVFA